VNRTAAYAGAQYVRIQYQLFEGEECLDPFVGCGSTPTGGISWKLVLAPSFGYQTLAPGQRVTFSGLTLHCDGGTCLPLGNIQLLPQIYVEWYQVLANGKVGSRIGTQKVDFNQASDYGSFAGEAHMGPYGVMFY
jgi:hypothetical protein